MRLVLEEAAERVGRAVGSRKPGLPVCVGCAAARHALGVSLGPDGGQTAHPARLPGTVTRTPFQTRSDK